MGQTSQRIHYREYIDQGIPFGYGNDSDVGDTDGFIHYLEHRFGPTASFTGTYKADRWLVNITGTEEILGMC